MGFVGVGRCVGFNTCDVLDSGVLEARIEEGAR